MGGFFRFYKLNWGDGFFFHPDEYHIVSAVSRISFPTKLNPHLFSYGSSIVYFTYIVKTLFNITNPFIAGRVVAATFSTISLFIIFLIAKAITNKKWALFATLLVGLTPGLIQQAHFATPESTLIAFLLLCLYFLLKFSETQKQIYYLLSSVALGLATGTKISALVFLPLVLVLPLLTFPRSFLSFIRQGFASLLGLLTVALTHFLIFPYSILDFDNFKATTLYESGLGVGNQIVFYTEQFRNTIPLIFQFTKIYPVTLGPAVLFTGILGLLICIRNIFSKKLQGESIIFAAFMLLLVSHAFLFTKWTRFAAPTFPFFGLFATYALSKIKSQNVAHLIAIFILVPTVWWTLAFFSIYTHTDVRSQADMWIRKNIGTDQRILTEARNMIEIPFGGYERKNFELYDLDDNPLLPYQLVAELRKSDYFIIQSRRLFANHAQMPHIYPRLTNFYTALFNGSLGFEEVKRFNSFPSLTFGNKSLVFPDEGFEETWSVFDHPVIRIYKKTKSLSELEYEKILNL